MIKRLSYICLISVLCMLGACGYAAEMPASSSMRPNLQVVGPRDAKGTPVAFGIRDLKAALDQTQNLPRGMRILVACPGDLNSSTIRAAAKLLPKKADSFVILRDGNEIAILGRNSTGAMYGCFELAERLDMYGRVALDIRKPIVQSPAVQFRAVNPFLTLPYRTDEKDWWFMQEDYWEGYLDQLARARFNWVDLHGMYDVKTTWFPNIYPYFVTSDKFPLAGADPAVAKRNLAMLNKVIKMADERGINFAIMSYSATWNGPGLRQSPYEETEENLAAYTREVVRKMIDSCPGLDMIGFRIGESGKSANFFRDSYIPAIKEAGREIDLYTRTWLSRKEQVLAIGKEFPGGRFFAEIKYNGEQFGAPYIVAGGRMQGWHSYSYQDYYSYPKNYGIIYQLRANGTHRVFPWGNPELAARANVCSTLGGAIGLCVEAIDSYYEKYDYRHRDDSPNRWFKWQWQRDWLWYNMWGRTAYDPSLKYADNVWLRMFQKRYGKEAAPDLLNAMKWASKIVPDAYTSHCFGPDHRNHAPELEWGGTVKDWANGQPLDTQNIQTPREYADRLIRGDYSGKATPLAMAAYLQEEAEQTRQYVQSALENVKNPTPEFNDLVTELTMLSYLGDYYSHKLTAAALFALMEASRDIEGGEYAGADRIREELALAHEAWNKLAAIGDEHYKPFVDTLRMGTEEYTWSKEAQKLERDFVALDEAVAAIKASGKKGTAPSVWTRGDGKGPLITKANSRLTPGPDNKSKKLTVTAVVTDSSGVGAVYLKTKGFPSERTWSIMRMDSRSGGVYTATVPVMPEGLMWSIEAVDKDGNGSMWPDFRQETPYRVVLPWDAPMPGRNVPLGLESISKIKPTTKRYSAMIAGRDAFALDGASSAAQNAIMESVRGGLSLIVLCQDAPAWSGKWLGGGIRFTDADAGSVRFVGDHPVLEGVPETFSSRRIINDALDAGEEWTHLTDPKGLAVRQYGAGRIVLAQMDISHSINDPAISTLFRNIFAYARQGSDKPMLVIDPGEESVFGLLASYSLPYKVLGDMVGE